MSSCLIIQLPVWRPLQVDLAQQEQPGEQAPQLPQQLHRQLLEVLQLVVVVVLWQVLIKSKKLKLSLKRERLSNKESYSN